MEGGLKICSDSKDDINYITGGSFSAFLFFGDIFQVFVIIIAILIITLGVIAFRKKKRDSDHLDRRATSLRREFSTVKEESYNYSEDGWIESRLDEDSDDLEETIITNKK